MTWSGLLSSSEMFSLTLNPLLSLMHGDFNAQFCFQERISPVLQLQGDTYLWWEISDDASTVTTSWHPFLCRKAVPGSYLTSGYLSSK